ncbi:pilus assembly protein CpaF [Colwellia sp. MT41]|uniref:Flp pilus assembly protein TadA n=1 Tax=Colwellia marinimaniae TaxID=1513592 RepID=A0ABQ0MR96_9GAMM|nr:MULTISPECIES: CpaF family protein [Colwellia]ALO34033.1 pilus assembly protein CpaF [Colwellia sp. MT41]GAW94875.1 Flp pilus assembly protein TadA [Colwellia marinimaniae]
MLLDTKTVDPFSILTAEDMQTKQEIFGKILTLLDLSVLETMENKIAKAQITELCCSLLDELTRPISLNVRQILIKLIIDEILGLGPLETLLEDPTIADILVNRYDSIYVERKGKLEKVAVKFYDDKHLLSIIDRIVSSVGRRVDESSPMVDARLKDGSRVNAIIPPLALDGPVLSIRRFTVDKLSAEQLIDYGTMSYEMGQLIKAVVKGKLNVLISGGTGSGKTTLLNILSGYIPEDERIITIEDSAELQLQQPHTVRLETRPANIEGKGEISQRDLVKNCLRMRPDRIVIGEVRGAEAIDMLAAMNTGHEGSLTTLHANSPRDALGRLENMICMGGFDMPIHNIRAQISSAIDVVVQLQRQEDGCRRITSIQEVTGMEGDVITMSEIFTFKREDKDEQGNIIGSYQATGVIPEFHRQLALKGIDLPYSLFGIDESTVNF